MWVFHPDFAWPGFHAFYRAALPLSSRTLTFVSGLIHRHRKSIGSCWRKLCAVTAGNARRKIGWPLSVIIRCLSVIIGFEAKKAGPR